MGRRPKNEPPTYQVHKRTGHAKVFIAGKVHWLGKANTPQSWSKYWELVSAWMAEGCPRKDGTIPATESQADAIHRGYSDDQIETEEITIATLVSRYATHADAYYRRKDKTKTSEPSAIGCAVGPLVNRFGGMLVADFRPKHLEEVQRIMIELKWVRGSINAHTSRIKQMFQWGVVKEIVPTEIYQSVQAVRGLAIGRTNAVESAPVKPAPARAIVKVLKLVTPQVAAMIRIQLFCGCRPGDIVIMRPCDIDRSGDVWIYTPATHKNTWRGMNYTRTIYLGPRAQKVLEPWLEGRDREAYCFSPAEARTAWHVTLREKRLANAKYKRIQPSQVDRSKPEDERKLKPGAKYSVSSYFHAIARACDRAGVEHWSPNQLRHSRGTAIRKQFGLETAQAVLGHAKMDVTQVYAQLNMERAKKAMKEVG